jgi:Mg-chelatase subunit ChlD
MPEINTMKLKAELDQFPKNISGKEAYNRLIALLAEDYKPTIDKLDHFDTTYHLTKEPQGVTNQQGTTSKGANVEILLDSSGSMSEIIDGRTKMDLAKEAIRNFLSSLPREAQVSLRVFGHKGSSKEKDKAVSCSSTELVYPFSSYNEQEFNRAMNPIKPVGWTPLAAAIQAAKDDLQAKAKEGVDNIVYIVSDGEETCGGNPVQEASELHTNSIKAVINIIGFNVDNAGQKALEEVAKAGGGDYTSVYNAQQLNQKFEEEKKKLETQWWDWEYQNKNLAGDRYSELLNKLNDILGTGGEYEKLHTQENQRLSEAMDYLEQKGKLDYKQYDVLLNLILDRDDKIRHYFMKRNDDLWNAIHTGGIKTQNQVEQRYKAATGN